LCVGSVSTAPQIILTKGGKVKSRCYINGSATTLRVLRLLSEVLVDVNGQGMSASLRDPNTQLALLDDIAGTGALVARFRSSLARYHILCARVSGAR
jgi:DNA repair ATPase RecN